MGALAACPASRRRLAVEVVVGRVVRERGLVAARRARAARRAAARARRKSIYLIIIIVTTILYIDAGKQSYYISRNNKILSITTSNAPGLIFL